MFWGLCYGINVIMKRNLYTASIFSVVVVAAYLLITMPGKIMEIYTRASEYGSG